MGLTRDMIAMGMEHGLNGEGVMKDLAERFEDHALPYIDGYQMGFLLRKIGANPEGPTEDQWDEFDRVYGLTYAPRYANNPYRVPTHADLDEDWDIFDLGEVNDG